MSRRSAFLALAALAGLVGGAAVAGPGASAAGQVVEAYPVQVKSPTQTSTVATNKVIREQRSLGDALRAMRIPVAHKTRSGGERAHRRWRQARASGRR